MKFISKSQRKGEFAEKYAKKFLVKHGHKIISTNFEIPGVGELDIVSVSQGTNIHLVEVKASFRETSREGNSLQFRPERHFNSAKLKRMYIVGREFLKQNPEFQHMSVKYDLITVLGIKSAKKIFIKYYPDINISFPNLGF